MLEVYQAFADYTDMMELTEDAHRPGGTRRPRHHRHRDRRHDRRPRRAVAPGPPARPRRARPSASRCTRRCRSTSSARSATATAWPTSPTWARASSAWSCTTPSSSPRWSRRRSSSTSPLEVSPLARVDRHDPDLVERFELVAAGRELANAYSELNDPIDQRHRFEDEQRAKEAGDARGRHRRRGLPAGPGVRPAADRRARRRHRPPGRCSSPAWRPSRKSSCSRRCGPRPLASVRAVLAEDCPQGVAHLAESGVGGEGRPHRRQQVLRAARRRPHVGQRRPARRPGRAPPGTACTRSIWARCSSGRSGRPPGPARPRP